MCDVCETIYYSGTKKTDLSESIIDFLSAYRFTGQYLLHRPHAATDIVLLVVWEKGDHYFLQMGAIFFSRFFIFFATKTINADL